MSEKIVCKSMDTHQNKCCPSSLLLCIYNACTCFLRVMEARGLDDCINSLIISLQLEMIGLVRM